MMNKFLNLLRPLTLLLLGITPNIFAQPVPEARVPEPPPLTACSPYLNAPAQKTSVFLYGPLSSGAQAPKAFHRLMANDAAFAAKAGPNVELVAMNFGPVLKEFKPSWRPQDFGDAQFELIRFDPNEPGDSPSVLEAENILRAAAKNGPVHSLTLLEGAVIPAGKLYERVKDLGILGNGDLPILRNKGLQMEAMRDALAKLKAEYADCGEVALDWDVPEFIYTDQLAEVLAWEKEHQLFARDGKVVVKLSQGSGTLGTITVSSVEELKVKFLEFQVMPELYGAIDPKVVVMEYIDFANEIAPNSFAREMPNGEVKIVSTDVYVYTKQDSAIPGVKIYDYDVALPSDHPDAISAVAFGKFAHQVFKIRNGFFHPEFFKVWRNGRWVWMFGEGNARVMGSGFPEVTYQARVDNLGPFEIAFIALFDPERFAQISDAYQLRHHTAVLTLATKVPNRRLSFRNLKKLEDLGLLEAPGFLAKEGDVLPLTTGLFDRLATLRISAPTHEKLMENIKAIHAMVEGEEFFMAEPAK